VLSSSVFKNYKPYLSLSLQPFYNNGCDVHLVSGFPAIHSSPLVGWQKVNNFSLLYVVTGSSVHLQPYLLMAHLDVVPADDVTKWDVTPFSAEIHDGFLYGRGTIDDKHNVFVCNTR